jgi:hypothetical protein
VNTPDDATAEADRRKECQLGVSVGQAKVPICPRRPLSTHIHVQTHTNALFYPTESNEFGAAPSMRSRENGAEEQGKNALQCHADACFAAFIITFVHC